MRCIAVDDEPLALALLEDNIRHVPYLELVGKCSNAFKAMEILNSDKIDLIFLDIQMAGLTGIQFLKTLTNAKPMVIFVTAYETYALEGYALDVVDYLVKPVALDRFIKACNKAKELFDLKNGQNASPNTEGSPTEKKNSETDNFFFVNADYSLIKIEVNDILYVEGMKDYVKVFLSNQAKPIITRMSVKAIEEKLNGFGGFVRVHKSFIISFKKVESIRNGYAFIQQKAVPISENFKNDLMKWIGE